MRLLTKITLLNLLLALAAFGVGGVRVYHKFRFEVQRETDFTLLETMDEVVRTIQSGVPAADLQNRLMHITPLAGPQAAKDTYTDTLAMHPVLKRPELFRRLQATRTIDGKTYRFMVMNVVIEQSDISRIIKNVLTDLFVVLGGILLVFNFLLSKWLLGPLNQTLAQIQAFNLTSGQVPEFPRSSTTEFSQLNTFLAGMLDKIRQDYHTLKEFSENASHEIQTPLAVASGKLELLLDTPSLDDAQVQLVQDAQQALSRLSKLGEALLLLTKIENQEFAPQTPVDFSALVGTDVQIFADLAELKGLQFSSRLEPGVSLRIEPSLAHILIGNLLKNAIRHNQEEGWIRVALSADQFCVQNSGPEPAVPTEQLFERFQKSKPSGASLGLGLAIVKKICTAEGWAVSYTYEAGTHCLCVAFANA
ncbi:MAG: HAMP domain-containing histidine kinase [Saprospiraceae bacterium]|nr:HAMP domain-containing histidine kinase [Saprospiraceae bacterium]